MQITSTAMRPLALFWFACGCVVLPRAAVVVTAQAPATTASSWGGCGSDGVVAIGDPTRVCLQIANGTAWNLGVRYIRPSFEPKADEYSRFHIPNCTCVCGNRQMCLSVLLWSAGGTGFVLVVTMC